MTLNRPEKLNALTVDLFKQLRAHILDITNDTSLNCIVLKGEGKGFSAGHDLEDIAEGEHVPSPMWH